MSYTAKHLKENEKSYERLFQRQLFDEAEMTRENKMKDRLDGQLIQPPVNRNITPSSDTRK